VTSNVINLHLPALRGRKEDIVPLAEFLLKRHVPAGAEIPVMDVTLKHAMMVYQWPGNVRELENFVRRFTIFRDAGVLARELQAKSSRKLLTVPAVAAVAASAAANTPMLPPPVPTVVPTQLAEADSPILEQVTKAKHLAETEAILAALNSTRWNRKQAAALLKIDYKALLYKMKKLGVEDRPVPFTAKPETPPKWQTAIGQ
jgi:two-component system response regulator AtoC